MKCKRCKMKIQKGNLCNLCEHIINRTQREYRLALQTLNKVRKDIIKNTKEVKLPENRLVPSLIEIWLAQKEFLSFTQQKVREQLVKDGFLKD